MLIWRNVENEEATIRPRISGAPHTEGLTTMKMFNLAAVSIAATLVLLSNPLAAEEYGKERITINGVVYERVGTSAVLDEYINPGGGGVRATCISGDHKKVCPCGDKGCIASDTKCACITLEPPPSSGGSD